MRTPKKKSKAQLVREAKRARNKAWKELSAKLRNEKGACEVCGETENLCVHHILEKRMHPDLWLDERDLVVICRKCHFKVHGHQAAEFFVWLADNKPAQWVWIAERARSYSKA